MKKRLLAVGDSTDIEIILSTGRRKGKFSKSPRMYTSDPSVSESRLRLAGQMIEAGDNMSTHLIKLNPYGVNLIIGEEDGDKYKIEVTNNSDFELKMDVVSSDPEYFTLKTPNKIKPGKTEEIEIKMIDLEARRESGFEKSFTIELNDPDNTRYTIPVTYKKEAKHVASHSSYQTGSSSHVTPTGLKTKTGNAINQIDAGTNKSR